MRSLIIILLAVAIVSVSCRKSNDDNVPPQQQIVTWDTSGMTGKLTVYVKYMDQFGNLNNANGSNVYLYASRDDITTDLSSSNYDLAIYRLNTGSSHSAYFGYINYGNYYILAFNTISSVYYEKISIVQVRPQQNEELTITLVHPTSK
jgi:hypothetical protein